MAVESELSEREREILAIEAQEYWTIAAALPAPVLSDYVLNGGAILVSAAPSAGAASRRGSRYLSLAARPRGGSRGGWSSPLSSSQTPRSLSSARRWRTSLRPPG